eukprot:jgi/Botrbrau1/3500/Bobra.341_2s0030.1
MKRHLLASWHLEGGVLHRAAKALRQTLEWRKNAQPHKVMWETIESHGAHGRVELLPQKSKDGKPIVLYRLRVPMDPITPQELQDQWIYWLESASFLADEEGDGAIVLVADFEQVPGVWIPGIRERISCLRVAQLHYPERMGLTVVTRPATLFWILWYGMQPFLDPVTKKKVAFAATGEEVKRVLADHIDPEHLYDSLGGSKGETVDKEALRQMMLEVDKRRAAHLEKAFKSAAA